ncbi:hypothetical protein [Streptomyces sp. NPDC002676]
MQILTEDHEDITDVLRQLEAVGVGQAVDAHPAPAGARPVRLSIVVRTGDGASANLKSQIIGLV